MLEEIFEFLYDYGFSVEEIKGFQRENEKLFFAILKNITDNISFLEAKGLSRDEVIEVIRKDPFMLTSSTKKKEMLDEIYRELFSDDEIKETIVKYPDMYIVSPLELQDVINYIKSSNLNPRQIINNNLNVLSFDLDNIKEEITQISFAEVLEVLKYVDESLVVKIPTKLLDHFREHQKRDFIVNIDIDDVFNKNNISKEALALLAYIDMEYWAGEEEKYELKKLYIGNEKVQTD